MPPTDPFIPIPSKTRDFRSCTRRLWAAGIDLVASFDDEWPQAAVGDGAGGQFVLAIENKQHLRLFHVSASGVKIAPAAPIASIGFASEVRARLVRSSAGSCIAVWCFANLGDRVLARRFGSDCLPMWSSAVDIFPTPAPPRYAMVSAAEDGAGGVVVCALRGGQDFLVQRLNAAGQALWATSAFSLPAFPSPTTPDTPQVVETGAGFAVLIQLPVTPTSPERNVLCQWVSSGGQLTGTWFTIGVAREQWWFRAGVRRVISDDAGGFWVALSPATGPLQLLRFTSNATVPAVTVTSSSLADFATYAIAPDGSGGVLVAMIEKAGSVAVDRFASAGARVFRVPYVAPPVSNLPVPDFPQLALSHRVVGVATRDTRDRGNILVTVQ